MSVGARWLKWLGRESTDRKIRGSNPTSVSRLPLSRLGQPGNIPALVLPSGGIATRPRKGVTAERLVSVQNAPELCERNTSFVFSDIRMRVHKELSKSFRKQSGVRQGCPLFSFLFKFVIKALEFVERFTYPGGCISSDFSVADEANARNCKARVALANLRHLWRIYGGMSMNLKEQWRKQGGGQPLTWQRDRKETTKRLGAVGAIRLPEWGPFDPHCVWLETLQDMAANRCQWRSCSFK
ncbi:hypothetical protein CSKR_108763 [Clonorchis sinensis]|uniref:Reverse transcriptase domain-containing protein n=1 Tax=Clonorchis sinensis TaxID=79923 RepID=A0A3R7JQ04_CLOSI|nr:hypothetical protein CSKR_108763 [Clonorchis sinensis]